MGERKFDVVDEYLSQLSVGRPNRAGSAVRESSLVLIRSCIHTRG
jgi:hypothetical protein